MYRKTSVGARACVHYTEVSVIWNVCYWRFLCNIYSRMQLLISVQCASVAMHVMFLGNQKLLQCCHV